MCPFLCFAVTTTFSLAVKVEQTSTSVKLRKDLWPQKIGIDAGISQLKGGKCRHGKLQFKFIHTNEHQVEVS